MNENLDIIPIHVFANSANQAEMLNGQLRAQGLAVKPLWRNETGDKISQAPELVFFFEDTEKPSFDEVRAYAQHHGAPLLVIARHYDPEAAKKALSAGAADWLLVDHDVLLSAAVLRERRHHKHAARIRQLELDKEHSRELLKQNVSQSQDAIVTACEGIVMEANEACAEYFGYPESQAIVGQPVMDLVDPGSQAAFKKALKVLRKTEEPQDIEALGLLQADGNSQQSPVRLEATEFEGEHCASLRITNDQGGKQFAEQIGALENENQLLLEQMDSLKQARPVLSLLQPGDFSPLASQLLGSAQSEGARALIFIHPDKRQEAHDKFGAIGMAELGTQLGHALGELLGKDDLATRTADLNLVLLITRPDKTSLEGWIASTLQTLGSKVFEGGEHSGQLGFVAGYTPVNRVRRLETLIQQAEKAAVGEAGTVTCHTSTSTVEVEVDDDSWETLIREALSEHRYTVTLEPVEDLASGARTQIAHPCLLDRDGQQIDAAVFQPPASRAGLLQVLEHRFVGHSLRALLSYLKKDDLSRVIVPLHHDTVSDSKLRDFLTALIKHGNTPLPEKGLVLEFNINDITNRIREVQGFAEYIQTFNCAFGLRDYTPSSETDKLVALLPLNSLRLSPRFTMQLEEDEKIAEAFQKSAGQYKQKNIDVIATDVSNSSSMASLYNFGISLVQGLIIGEPELFQSDEKNEEPNGKS